VERAERVPFNFSIFVLPNPAQIPHRSSIAIFLLLIYIIFKPKGSCHKAWRTASGRAAILQLRDFSAKGVIMSDTIGIITVVVIVILVGGFSLAYLIWSRNDSEESEDQTKR
jgi:hypothetical protein